MAVLYTEIAPGLSGSGLGPGGLGCVGRVIPGVALAAVVERFWSVEGVVDEAVALTRVLPDGCMDIIFDLGGGGAGRESAGHGLRRYVVGAMREAVVVAHAGAVDLVGIRFRPGGARAFVGAPADELTDRVVDLELFWRGVGSLAEMLAGTVAPGPDATRPPALSREPHGSPPAAGLAARARLRARAERLESALLDQARAGGPAQPALDPLVGEATRLIRGSRGSIRVRELEHSLGTTERTLQRRFAAAVGLTPKEAARIARFGGAASRLRRSPAASLARVAHEYGYADQAHFTREFQRLAGTTPAAYAREAGVGFVQDEDPPSA